MEDGRFVWGMRGGIRCAEVLDVFECGAGEVGGGGGVVSPAA